jgi:amino acid adenylation domain-containing protein
MEDLAQAYNGQVLAPPPPFQSFVSYLQESDELTTNAFWEGMFQGLEAPSWPVVASTTHQLRADTNFAHTITGVDWPRESNITASTILRATLAILMGEYSAASEVLFGATVIGRQAPVESVDRMTGPTITTVPIRTKLVAEQSIDGLLRDIQKQAIDIMPFEQIGLKRLRRISDDAEQACQFQTLLVVQPGHLLNDPSRQQFEHSIHAEAALNKDTVNTAFNTYALQVVCDLMDDGITADFIADPTIIEQTQLRRMAFQFEHILQQICSLGRGASRVANIQTVSAHDRVEIGSWNSKPWTPVKQCVLELLEMTSHRKPSATAICAWDGGFTYAELETLSTKLSYNLVTCGVKPGVTVPILFEKSKWMSIALIAVIKAGGTGVTLDSSLPENRLRSIVEQVNPKLIVSSPACEALADLLTTERVVLIDDRRLAQLPSPPENYLLPAVTPDDHLYIAFTSGSTGRPKGVVVSHTQFSSAIKYQQQGLCITEISRVYEFVSFAWDGIWLHLLFTLAAGACLCVPSEADRRDRIAESMRALQANYVHLTPTVARMLNPSQVRDLKCVGLVGEAMLTSDKDQWTRFGIKVLNLYGPTECTPLSSCAEIGNESEGALVIGKGFGANLWIVRPQDSSHGLAPIGAVGELVIDGPIVSKGYFSDAVSTSKIFASNPPWLKQDARHVSEIFVYKTGDLVRYTSDGNVVIVGRKDSQVKIRGQRVELNNIESHMRRSLTRNAQSTASQQARISGFADVLIPAEIKTPALVAFLHVHSAEDLSRDELRSVVGQVVPGLVQQLTSSLRKIGQLYTLEQLSALNPERGIKQQPVKKTEVFIQQLWSQVLDINAENIGCADSFFQVGGDSVSAMSLAGIARDYGLSLTVSDIFKNLRLEDLAAAEGEVVAANSEILPFSLLPCGMDEESVRAQAARLCRMKAEHIEDVFPSTPMQEGLLAITARRAGAFTARYTLELQISVDLDQFCQAWTEVLQATPVLRTRIIDLPGQGLVQVVSKIAEQWTESDSLDHLEVTNPSMTMGLGLPLNLQSIIIEKETKRRFFIWTVHHALYDGWSRSLVMNRLEKAYRGETLGRSPPFQIFAKHLADLNTRRCESFWQELLSGIEAPSFPSLPMPAYEPQADKSITNVISNIDWPKGDITPSTIV